MATLIRTKRRKQSDDDEDVRQHSGWLIPLSVFVVTAGLSALFLLFYLAPNPTSFIEQHAAPTDITEPVTLIVGDLTFKIPANYIVYRSARQGGERKDVALFALLPAFKGYTAAEAQAFADHSADSRVLHILIRKEHLDLPENERLKRIYMSYVVDPAGKSGPFGLTEYTFRNDNGYRGEDMFVGGTPDKPVVMRCWRLTPDMSNPDCVRDRRLSRGVAMTYRFKRARLGEWRAIAQGVGALIGRFEAAAK